MIDQTTAPATTQQASATIRDVLRNQNFVKLWTAQILSQTAQQIVNYALVIQVDRITHSGTAVSGIVIAFTIPAILFAAIAGVFVERNSKKTMLVATNVARGIMVLAYLFTDPAWGLGAVLPIIYVVTLLFSTVSQFFNPAEASMIPLIVNERELVSANSLFNLTLPATQLGGFVLLGPLLLSTVFHDNFNGLYFVIFLLCLAAAGSTFLLPQDRPEETAAERRKKGEKVHVTGVAGGAAQIAKSGFRTALDELAEGWRFIRHDRVIMSAIIYWSVAIAVFMMLGVIGPGFLRTIGIEQSKLIYILLPGGVGLVAGVLMIGRIATRENREIMINISLFFAGVALMLFAVVYPLLSFVFTKLVKGAPSETMVLLLLGFLTMLLGLFNSFISVPAQTALQERSPEKIRARVFSAFFTVSNATLILPTFFAGALADALGYAQAVFMIGVAVLLIAGYGLFRLRQHKKSEEEDAAEEMEAEEADRAQAKALRNGYITPEEAEAALTAASPAPRPLLARELEDIRNHEQQQQQQQRERR